MPDDLPDIVYAVRRSDRNDELALSLRSLTNLPHRRVFIAGHCPPWVRDVTAVAPSRRSANKYDAIQANVTAAIAHPELGERFVYFNDDFYVMEPIDEVPVTNGGPSSEYRGIQELKIRMRQTCRALEIDDPLTFDGVHTPLPVVTECARRIMAESPRGVLWRTLYGNLTGMTGTRVSDVKSRHGDLIPGPFLSTSPRGFRVLRSHLQDVIPGGSPYVR